MACVVALLALCCAVIVICAVAWCGVDSRSAFMASPLNYHTGPSSHEEWYRSGNMNQRIVVGSHDSRGVGPVTLGYEDTWLNLWTNSVTKALVGFHVGRDGTGQAFRFARRGSDGEWDMICCDTGNTLYARLRFAHVTTRVYVTSDHELQTAIRDTAPLHVTRVPSGAEIVNYPLVKKNQVMHLKRALAPPDGHGGVTWDFYWDGAEMDIWTLRAVP